MLYVTSKEVGTKFFKTRWPKMSSFCTIKEIASFKRLALHLHRIVTFISHPFQDYFLSSVLNSKPNTLYWLLVVGNARGFGDGNAKLVLGPSVCIKYNKFIFTLDIDICGELFFCFIIWYLLFITMTRSFSIVEKFELLELPWITLFMHLIIDWTWIRILRKNLFVDKVMCMYNVTCPRNLTSLNKNSLCSLWKWTKTC